jgi:hypothetical protein
MKCSSNKLKRVSEILEVMLPHAGLEQALTPAFSKHDDDHDDDDDDDDDDDNDDDY